MRIYTTTLLLTCTVLFGSALTAMAQAPVFTAINVKHDCGLAPGDGSFVVNVTSASGDVQVIVSAGGFLFDTGKVTPSGFPYNVPVPNLSGATGGGPRNYIILVSDDNDSDTKSQSIFNFSVSLTSVTHNTNPGCATPNGAIDVSLAGSSPIGAIQYLWTWTGPGVLPSTQDLSGLSGGDYFLSYTDGVTTCNLGPIHINDPAPAPFSIASVSDICEGNNLLVDVFTPTAGYTYSVMEGPSVLASVAYASGALQITVPAAAMTVGIHPLQVRASAGVCPVRFNDPPGLNVTVHAEPVGHNSTKTICANIAVNVTLTTDPTPVPAATYDIAVNPNGLTLASGTPSAGTGKLANEIADDVWTNTGLGSVAVTYTITPVSAAPASCPGAPFTVIVTVNPQPVGADIPITRCTDTAVGINLATSGASVAAATYNIITNNGGLTQVAGTTSAGNGKAANELFDDVWRNTGLGSVNVVYTVTPVSAAGCLGDPFVVTVAIDPGPIGTNVAMTICSDIAVGVTLTTNPGSVAALNYTIAVNSNGLSLSAGTPSAGAGKAANEIADDVWRNTTLFPVNVLYSITPVSAALCSGDLFTVAMTVNPEPVGSNSAFAVCTDLAVGFTLTTSAGSVAAANYAIAVNTNGLTQAGGTDSNGAGKAANEIADDVWTNPTGATVDVVYTITPMSSDNCAGDNFTVTVTIKPEPVGVVQNVTVCSDALVNVTLGVAGGSVAAATYNIAVNANGLVFSGTTASSGVGKLANELMDDRWTNPGLSPVNVVYTIVPVSAGLCQGDPFTVTVTVDPEPAGTNSTATRCSDEALNVDLSTNVSGVATATFDIAINANGLIFSGATPSAGTGKLVNELIDDAWTNTGLLPVNVTYTINPVTASSCAGNSFTVIVTVNPEPVGANSSMAVCSDQVVGFTLSTSGASVAAQTYNINVNSNGLSQSAGTDSNGPGKASNEIADDVWTNTTIAAVNVVYTIVPVSAALCQGNVFTVTVTVNPEPVGADAGKTICSNSNVAFNLQVDDIDALGNALPATAFSWTVANNGSVTGESVGPQTSVTITDILVNTSSVDQPVVYTVTPRSSLLCAGTPFTVTIIVSPRPVLVVGQTADVCSGTAAGYEILLNPANLPAGTTFTWAAPTMSDGSIQGTPGASVAMGPAGTVHINDVLTNIAAAPITATYTVTPSLGGLCAGTPRTVVVSVYRAPTAEAGANQALCIDFGPYTLVGSSLGGSATTGTWSFFSQPGGGVLTQSPVPGNPAMAKFESTTPGAYVLQLTTDVTPVCGAVSDFVTITVMDKPVVLAGQTKTTCGNDPVAYEILMAPVNFPANTVFNWPDPDGSGPAQAGVNVAMGTPGTIHINDVLVNNGTIDIPVQYDVTPSVGLCVGALQSIIITVRPAPVVAFGQTKIICSGDLVNYEILLSPANSPIGTTFSWPDPDGAGPGTSKLAIAADPPGTFHITDRLFNGTGVQIPVIYSVISTGTNGCRGVTRDITIIVNPGDIVEAGNSQAVCSSGTATLTGSSIGGLAIDGTWSIVAEPPGGGNGIITGGTATTTPDAATFTASIAGNYTLRLTTNPGGACPAVSDDVIITVKSPGDPSCTGGTGTCPSSIVPEPTSATCNNSDGSVFFRITPPTPISGDVKITIDRTIPATPPETRTNFASVDGFTFNTLPAGKYSYVIEYGGPSCTKIGDFTINRSGTIGTLVASNLIDPTCFGETGAATIDALNETGNILQWSADGITFTDFIAGTSVTGLPAGTNLISVKKAGDPCAAGVFITLTDPTEVSAGLLPADATCFNNDGSITVSNLTGGTGPYTFDLNGAAINIPASNIINGLTANTYDLIITDSKGCVSAPNPVIVSFPGYVNHTAPVTTSPDCSGGGANGKVEFTISDPGSFQFALTTDLVLEPATYNPLGGSLVSISNLANGDYAVWLKPMGAGTKCATKVPVTISGVYAVSYTATTSDVICFAQPTSVVLSNITGAPGLPYGFTLTNTSDNSVIIGTISASQALSAFSITNINPGNYSILLTQNQSSLVPSCTMPINGGANALVVNGPSASLDSLYVKRAISFPDLPSGSALVGVNPSGLEPYETRLELTTPLFGSQEFVSDWTEVSLNPQNLKFERSYTNLYAGVYTLGIRDAGGCERTYVFTLKVDTNLFIPNVFTPNGDGHNEVFFIRNLPADTKLLVTNRWGKEVFKSGAYTNDWNGGDTVDGLYYYTLTLGSENYNGWVEIMRGQ
ncbi:MAG TPA: PKD-like domain-containing protein [Cyclobacteriaceae bacterium]|nr:PKD-like domain-containing protein [Cyclobacteriaceae bacterium]